MKNFIFFVLISYLSILFLPTNSEAKIFNNFQENKQYCENPNLKNKFTKSISFVDVTDLKLKMKNPRKWYTNLFRIIVHRNINIPDKYKKKYKANLQVLLRDGTVCTFKATVRIHGDEKSEHVQQIENGELITSLNVRLNEGNIDSIVKFILLIPDTRNSDNEIFTTHLLKNLGFISPRSKYVNLTFNKSKRRFIFQEKVTKELIENNNLTEGPIIEASQRFVWPQEEGEYFDERFAQGRIVNEAWALKNNGTLDLSLIALSKFNQTISQHKSIFNLKNLNSEDHNSRELFAFDAILASIGAFHGLKPRDRKFYFDPISLKFRPIYYDGNSEILNRKNIFDEFKSEINLNQKKGAKDALNLLNEINLIQLQSDLSLAGIKLSLNEINNIVNLIKNNLNLLNNSKLSSEKIVLKKEYFKEYHIDAKTKRLVFHNTKNIDHNNSFTVCDFELTNCKNENLNQNEIFKLVSGKLTKSNYEYIFISNNLNYYQDGTYNNSIENFNKDFKKKYIEGVELIFSKNMKLNIDQDNKTIIFEQSNLNDIAIFKNGYIRDWKIFFIGTNKNKKEKDYFYFNGCLIFVNMGVENLILNTQNTYCEDAINFINSTGKINSLNIEQSLNDGIDMDFSAIEIKSMNVNNVNNDCLDLSYGNYNILSMRLNNCGDKGISVGEKSSLYSENVLVENSNLGFTIKDSSFADIKFIDLKNIKVCLSAYNKKQMFYGGTAKIDNYNCKNFYKEMDIDAFSQISINEY